MGIYLVPAYIKPYSKILSWTLPMAYIEEEEQEYICDLKIVVPRIVGQIRYFTRGEKLTMRTDLRGNPEQYKVLPDVATQMLVHVEDFIKAATQGKSYGKLEGSYNLLGEGGTRLVEDVYNLLDSDLRPMIATPLQWLVWAPKQRLLTRLCWIRAISGRIVIRPYGSSGLLLETEGLKLDKVNSV
ncbi:MAG: hypothetical protein DRJ67_11665, partial [Thermoprotei archaeon]